MGVLGHRLVVLCDSHDFSERLPKLEARVSRSAKIKKIGATAGTQRIVRIFSHHGPVKIFGAGGAAIATLKFAQMSGITIPGLQSLPLLAEFWNITQGMPPIIPISLTFSGLLLTVAKYYYARGYASVMTDDLEQASDADISQELAVRRACLRAQIREALDAFGFGKDNTILSISYGRISYSDDHCSLDTLSYGETDRKIFHRLRLDFQEPINRHDVARAGDFATLPASSHPRV